MVNPAQKAESSHTEFTGSIPETYDTYLGPYLFEFSGYDLANRVKNRIPEDGKVLEIACGTGISTYYLRQALPETVSITATDLNPAMLGFAKSKRGDLANVTFGEADALSLSFEDNGFDAVICQFGIMFFPDKAAGLAEMVRVLKPGGMLAFNVWDSMENNKAVKIAHETISKFFESDPPQFLHIPFGFYDIDHIRGLMAKIQLDNIESHIVSEKSEGFEASNIAKGAVEGNPGVLEINERANADAGEITKAVTEALEAEYGPSPITTELQEIVFIATKLIG
ncbi:MAG: class I SAM-dependent methyltransferase [Alphaproteobacteria bacterium]|nr:class I SAM-dependent methyltransferase [Alphaproteobacteria bacterium]